MRLLPTAAIALLTILSATFTWAGPPLVCHPWHDPQDPPAIVHELFGPSAPPAAELPTRLLAALDCENDTLVRMSLVQQLAHRDQTAAEARAFLDALARRESDAERAVPTDAAPDADAVRRARAARFDRAFAEETFAYTAHGAADPRPDGLAAAVQALGNDPAAWLALARACTPLMRTGSLETHARAFVSAHDLAGALPEGPARERLRWVLAWDLEHLEAHLLDRDAPAAGPKPDAAWRLSMLRSVLPSKKSQGGLVVHEWGTFTSMQGSDGIALEGLQREEERLPEFVYSRTEVRECPLRDRGYKGLEVPVAGVTQKMETPVIYFYTPIERRLRVRVDFVRGLLTQWYPVVDRLGPPELAAQDAALDLAGVERSFLEWEIDLLPRGRGVPAEMPEAAADDPWSFAREVNAAFVRTVPRRAPERVGPTEAEQYLFYRGLGTFALPLQMEADGARMAVRNHGPHAVPALFAVEMGPDGGRFQALGSAEAGVAAAVALDAIPLRPRETVVPELQAAVVEALVGNGLFAEEARAMVRTWSRQWFGSEGARILWIVPRPVTDALLPLKIDPAPDRLERVLLGRLEYLTPQVEEELEAALRDRASGDPARGAAADVRLARCGRFLEAAVRRVLARTQDEGVRAAGRAVLDSLR